jgi:hypothetical protein
MAVQDLSFFRDSLQFKLLLVERASTMPTLDSPKVLIKRQGQEKAANVGARVDMDQPPSQVVEILRRAPKVINDEVTVAEMSVVRYKQRDGQMQVLTFVDRRWVRCDKVITIQHHALVDAFGERFSER